MTTFDELAKRREEQRDLKPHVSILVDTDILEQLLTDKPNVSVLDRERLTDAIAAARRASGKRV